MGVIGKAQRVADKLIGLNDNVAIDKALAAGCRVRFIVMDGQACGRNHNASNSDLCLFSGKDRRITRAVIGSKGIYDDPELLALEALRPAN